MRRLAQALAACVAINASARGGASPLIGIASGQDFPARQIVLVVPFPAGGSTDAIARIISEPMRIALGQTVVVQNVTGARSTIGVGRAIQSAPDGYTLSVGNWTSHVGASTRSTRCRGTCSAIWSRYRC